MSRPRLLTATTIGAVALHIAFAFMVAPEDAVQGPSQRIFYVHVPSAWIGFLALGVLFVASIVYLRTRDPRYDEIASASAAVGAVFITGVLITGPLWARAAWGVFWVWDPRLTSFFVLWLIVVSYLLLRRQVTEPGRRARYSAVLGIMGFLDVPIVYLSVSWWRGLHPAQVVVTREGPQMPLAMLATLGVGLISFTLLYLCAMRSRLRVERLSASALDEEAAE